MHVCLAMETTDLERSVFRFISNNRKEHQQTGDKKPKTTVALHVFLTLLLSSYLSLIYYDFPCMQSNI